MTPCVAARSVGLLLAAVALGLTPPAAQAQGADPPWQWEAAIYGWLPAISGSTTFPSGGGGPGVGVSAEEVLDALKMVFMAQIEARKGLWGIWSDVAYADLGATRDATRDYTVGGHPANVAASLGLDIKATAWTTAGLYSLAASPQHRSDLLFGARMLDLKETLNWSLAASIPELPGRSGSGSADQRVWDGIVGLKGRVYLGDAGKWFLPYYADVGAGQSKSTWQVNAGLGYRFDWGSLFATYRYLDYQFKSGQPVQSMTFSGGLLGVGFQW